MGLSILLGLGSVGCGSDEGPILPQDNTAPTIQFTFDKLAVVKASQSLLTVAVADVDGDSLTVTWAITRGGNTSGIVFSGQGTPNLTWQAPTTAGENMIVATVSDGRGGQKSITETIKVGTVQIQDITSAVVWTLTNSPYILRPSTNSMTITSTLTINAGVEVLVDKRNADITVEGALTVNGTSANPVLIIPNFRTNPKPPFWGGIVVTPSGPVPEVNLSFARITHAVNAVRSLTVSNATLNGCTIEFCSSAAVLHESRGNLTVTNCTIKFNQGSGIRVELSASLPDSVTIQNNTITLNGVFDDPPVTYVKEAGISLIFNDPTGAVPIDISGNSICRNDFAGIRLGNPSVEMALYPSIMFNGIFGNEFTNISGGKLNLVLEPMFNSNGVSSKTLDARNNFWGSPFPSPADSVAIRLTIQDGEDFPAAGVGVLDVHVLVDPWLQAAP